MPTSPTAWPSCVCRAWHRRASAASTPGLRTGAPCEDCMCTTSPHCTAEKQFSSAQHLLSSALNRRFPEDVVRRPRQPLPLCANPWGSRSRVSRSPCEPGCWAWRSTSSVHLAPQGRGPLHGGRSGASLTESPQDWSVLFGFHLDADFSLRLQAAQLHLFKQLSAEAGMLSKLSAYGPCSWGGRHPRTPGRSQCRSRLPQSQCRRPRASRTCFCRATNP